jgi:hypothetical protein
MIFLKFNNTLKDMRNSQYKIALWIISQNIIDSLFTMVFFLFIILISSFLD